MRARNIKPSIFSNEDLGTSDPFMMILFEGLWCLADREGRLEDRPLRIKAQVFPYRPFDFDTINGYLSELERLGFIRRYQVGELKVIQILTFTIHQSPHNTEKASKLPPECVDFNGNNEITVTPSLINGESTNAERSDSLNPDSLNPEPIPDAADAAAVPDSKQVETIFDAWRRELPHHERSVLDKKRRARIKARLAEKFPVEDLCLVPVGVKRSPHHMGENDKGTVFDGIETIFRDAAQVEKFIALARQPANGSGNHGNAPPLDFSWCLNGCDQRTGLIHVSVDGGEGWKRCEHRRLEAE